MKTVRGAGGPIRVVDLVFSRDGRKSVQTLAFNLPNDERVRAEKGAKKVLLRNIIEKKFDLLMRPTAELLLDPSQLGHLSADAFFNETLFHELSHSLGPAFTKVDGREVEVRIALGPTYSPIEEAKADVMGAYDVLFLVDRGDFPASFRADLLVSYFAGLFRSVRFGVGEAHGKGAAVQLNRFLEEEAARFDDRECASPSTSSASAIDQQPRPRHLRPPASGDGAATRCSRATAWSRHSSRRRSRRSWHRDRSRPIYPPRARSPSDARGAIHEPGGPEVLHVV
jgi:hypothetical protein